MKLHELYIKRPVRESKTLRASMQLCEATIKVLEAESETKYGVYSKGGSIGSKGKGKPVATFDNREDAMSDAKRRRKGLTKGEKGYYGMGYSVKPIKEGLNDAGSFDFEPDPAFAGVKGITRDTGAGNIAAAAAEKKGQNTKLNQTWQKLVANMGKLDARGAQKLKFNLEKLAKVAQQKGFELSPSPESVLHR